MSGDEIVHTVLNVAAAKTPYAAIFRTVHIHPTVAEYLPMLLGDLSPAGLMRSECIQPDVITMERRIGYRMATQG